MNEKNLLGILEKFGAMDIAELEYCEGGDRLLLRKEAAFKNGGGEPAQVRKPAVQESAPESAQQNTNAAAKPAGAVVSQNATETITSPIVATFYASPGPDAPPFVQAGSKVKAGDSICILEAMKMMNRLEAEFDCEIVSIKAGNGDLVEFAQPLFEVKRV